jgi:uncharacterized membrane protein YbhN (UPF0104 family)
VIPPPVVSATGAQARSGLPGSPQHLVAFLARHGSRARLAVSAISLLALLAVIAPDLDDVDRALVRFQDIHPWWLLLGIWAQVAVVMASARFQRRLLRAGGLRLPLREAAAVVAADSALALSVSGGTVLGAGYVQRHAARHGAEEGLVTTIAWLTQLLSAALLGAVVVIAAEQPLWRPVPLVSALAALGSVALLVLVVQQPFAVASWTGRALHRLPRIGARAQNIVATQAERLSRLTVSRRDWAVLLTLGAWIAVIDCVCLFATARAVGVHPGFTTTVLCYAAVQTALAFPLTPGAVGLVESAMWGTAVARHVPRLPALTWTLLYRGISFWLVLVVGWSCYALLQRQARHRSPLLDESTT